MGVNPSNLCLQNHALNPVDEYDNGEEADTVLLCADRSNLLCPGCAVLHEDDDNVK